MIKPKSGERCLPLLKQELLLAIHSFGDPLMLAPA